MKHLQKPPPQQTKNPAYRLAFERLDTALAKNPRSIISESEKTRSWLLQMFGRAPGTVKLPK